MPIIYMDAQREKVIKIKGYLIPCGYMGFINGNYQLFATENEYVEMYKEVCNGKGKML